jgi:hypothetical protein
VLGQVHHQRPWKQVQLRWNYLPDQLHSEVPWHDYDKCETASDVVGHLQLQRNWCFVKSLKSVFLSFLWTCQRWRVLKATWFNICAQMFCRAKA